ncbi:hypothetical protein BVRB_028730 [Beta vulgaris subsp. vulgaris]|uniref:Uncharacterized protein n=1 Tax=Beta vulgaris subsp. vulgaris TaxID=3555 RepID=A0A0J8AYB1_BETVV|nr:hypothetical protein BVRB_028730 [Beta vulgaris subsp. vulgaris]
MRDPRFDTLVSMTVIEPGDKQSITTTTSSSATPTVQSLVVSDENVESHLLDCRVHDMKTVPRALLLQQTLLASTLYRNAQATQPLLGLSSAAIQHAVPPPRFIVLTASRVMFYGISRPLEQLTQLLSSNCSAATLQAAMSKLGMAESCAMLLTIICSSTMPVASDKRSVPGRSPEPYTVHV